MGAARSFSVAIGLADPPKKVKVKQYAERTPTNYEASLEVGFAVRGGLTRTQLHFLWHREHSDADIEQEEARSLIRFIIRAYPRLLMEALDLSFVNYSRCDEPVHGWEKFKDRAFTNVQPLWDALDAGHGQLKDDDVEEMVEQQMALLELGALETISMAEFIEAFQHTLGPSIAANLIAPKFEANRLEQVASQYERQLVAKSHSELFD